MRIDWRRRSEREEIMDRFTGSIGELEVLLHDITRVNKILGGTKITVDAVFALIREETKKSYTILDMGCADGHMLRSIALEARNQKVEVNLIGVDLNKDALRLAAKASADFPEISYRAKDILTADFSDFECDIVISTLTMHHFPDKEILKFMERFEQLSSIGIVINDLQRSRLAYGLFRLFSLVFIQTKTARIDGLISITKGFTRNNLNDFAHKLPHLEHSMTWKWAFRYVWVMRKKRQKSI